MSEVYELVKPRRPEVTINGERVAYEKLVMYRPEPPPDATVSAAPALVPLPKWIYLDGEPVAPGATIEITDPRLTDRPFVHTQPVAPAPELP